MNLGDKVSVRLEITGEVVGRTFEVDPKVDLKLPWGMLNGIPLSVLMRNGRTESEDVADTGASNVTEIRAAQKRRKAIAAAG